MTDGCFRGILDAVRIGVGDYLDSTKFENSLGRTPTVATDSSSQDECKKWLDTNVEKEGEKTWLRPESTYAFSVLFFFY